MRAYSRRAQASRDAKGETVAGAELSVVMNPDYPIVGDHPLVPALWATCDAARDFGLSDAELWRIVQEVLSDWGRDPSLSQAVAR